jgi:hypothetical protein
LQSHRSGNQIQEEMTPNQELSILRAKASKFMSEGRQDDFDSIMEAIRDLEAEDDDDGNFGSDEEE